MFLFLLLLSALQALANPIGVPLPPSAARNSTDESASLSISSHITARQLSNARVPGAMLWADRFPTESRDYITVDYGHKKRQDKVLDWTYIVGQDGFPFTVRTHHQRAWCTVHGSNLMTPEHFTFSAGPAPQNEIRLDKCGCHGAHHITCKVYDKERDVLTDQNIKCDQAKWRKC